MAKIAYKGIHLLYECGQGRPDPPMRICKTSDAHVQHATMDIFGLASASMNGDSRLVSSGILSEERIWS